MSYCFVCGKELLLRQHAVLVDGVPELFCPKCFDYFANHPEQERYLPRFRDLRAADCLVRVADCLEKGAR